MIEMKRLCDNHEFCRNLYKEISKDFTKEFLRSLWAHKSINVWEVHGEHDFYWHGRADCSYHAKAKALEVFAKGLE